MTEKILITGTRKGIGKYLAEHYCAKGHTVVGCSRGPADYELENYHHVCADVTDEGSVVDYVREANSIMGGITVLLNNAGIASMNHSLLTPTHTVESIFATNVFGTFSVAREAAKCMVPNRYGRIVNFATVATPLKLEGEAAYAASKAAVVSLTEVMSFELAEFGITVNAVGPTPVETDLIKNVPKAKMDALLARQALRRFGVYTDISNVTDFFASRDSGFVTGQTIYLGGVS